MAIIEDAAIVGYLLGEECICRSCMNSIKWEKLSIDNLLFKNDLEDSIRYFCDRCRKEIR